MEAIFGYGSLILPTSLIGRFDPELREKRDRIKEKEEHQSFLSFYLEDEAIRKWEASSINFVPVKIYGLKRFYSVEHYEQGNMLAAEEASQEEYVNGVLIFPLDHKEFEKVAETEKGYKVMVKDREDIESYIPEEKLEDKGLEMPEKVKVFVAADSERVNKDTDMKRMESYHDYIPNGIRLLAEKWVEETDRKSFREKFMQDFRETTFEIDDNGKWRRLSKNEHE